MRQTLMCGNMRACNYLHQGKEMRHATREQGTFRRWLEWNWEARGMRKRITKIVVEVVTDPKLRRAWRLATVHAAKEFVRKFWKEYDEGDPDDKERKKG